MFYKKLVGEKVYLSPMNSKYYEKYPEWLNSGRVSVGLNMMHKIWTQALEKETIEKMEMNTTDKLFAIVRLDNDELIGNCGIFSIREIGRNATVGLFIGDEENRGGGYGRDTMALLLDFAFNYLNLNTIKLEFIEYNKLAENTYKRVGFKTVGRYRERAFIKGRYFDVIAMDITAKDFRSSEYNGHIKVDFSEINI